MYKLLYALIISAMMGNVAEMGKGSHYPVVIKNPIGTTINQGITVNKMPYSIVKDENSLPKNVQNFINQSKERKGYKLFEMGNNEYVLVILGGEKPSTGFEIKIRNCEDNEGKTKVMVEEVSPKPDAIVGCMITYPHIVLKLKNISPNMIISSDRNEQFEEIK